MQAISVNYNKLVSLLFSYSNSISNGDDIVSYTIAETIRNELIQNADPQQLLTSIQQHLEFPPKVDSQGIYYFEGESILDKCFGVEVFINNCSYFIPNFDGDGLKLFLFNHLISTQEQKRSQKFLSISKLEDLFILYSELVQKIDKSSLLQYKSVFTKNLLIYMLSPTARPKDLSDLASFAEMFKDYIDFDNKILSQIIDILKGQLVRDTVEGKYDLYDRPVTDCLKYNNYEVLTRSLYLFYSKFASTIARLDVTQQDIDNSVIDL